MSAAGLLAIVGGGTLVAGLMAAAARSRKRHRAVVAAALNHDLSRAVEAHMRRTGASRAEVERLDREFRRRFVVAAASTALIGMGSEKVDGYWHTLIEVEDGELYAGFSDAVAGRRIEHVEGVGSPDLDARAWVAYEAVWGEPPPADLFPEPPEELKRRYRAQACHTGGDGAGGGDVCVAVSACSDGGAAGSCGDGGGGSSCGGGGGCGGG